jgi:hypothetical protein
MTKTSAKVTIIPKSGFFRKNVKNRDFGHFGPREGGLNFWSFLVIF